MVTFSNIKIRKIPGIPLTSPIERDIILAASMFIWQNMGLTSEQLAFGIATMGVESTFNPNALARTTTAFGLGQFTNDTWKSAVDYYNSNYGSTFGALSSANENDPATYIAVMGAWVTNVWTIATNNSNDPRLSGFSTAEIAYGMWHEGIGTKGNIANVAAFLKNTDPKTGFNYPGLRGYFDTTLNQATLDIANLQQTTGTGMCAPGQTNDPNATYCKYYGTIGNVTLIYNNGVTYTFTTSTQQWSVPDGSGGTTTYTRDVYNSATSNASFGDWVTQHITSSGVIDANGIVQAPQDQIAITSGVSSVNPFLDPATAQAFALAEATGSGYPSLTNQAINIGTGNTDAITICASGTSIVDRTIKLTLSSGTCELCTGANMIAFDANGNAIVIIPAGQDHVTITLVDTANTSSADIVSLTASIVDPNAVAGSTPVASNVFNVTFDSPNPNAGSSVTPDNTINGDLNPQQFYDTNGNVYYKYDSLGNIITDGTSATNRSDGLYGSTGNDLINTGGGTNSVNATQGGNDTINGGNGNDSINGGNGKNLISGGGGQDIILVGNGSNQIYANTQVDLATALASQKTVTANPGQLGSFIAVGNGNNTIVGSDGGAIFTGTGNNTIVCGNGAVTVFGGLEYYTSLITHNNEMDFYSNNFTYSAAIANDFEWRKTA